MSSLLGTVPGNGLAPDGSGVQIRLLAQALRCMEECVSVTDVNDRILFVNSAFLRTYGYEEHDLLGRHISMVRGNPRLEGGVEQILTGTIEGGWRGELWNRKKDGTEFPILLSTAVVRDENGAPMAFIGVARDLTAKRQAESAQSFQTALLEAQMETALDGILVVDESRHVLMTNHRFAEMWRLPEEVANCRSDEQLLQQIAEQVSDFEAFVATVRHLYSHPYEKTRDEIPFKDGRTFERYSAPLIDSHETLRGRIFYFRDISERKRAEESVRRSEWRYRNLYESMMDAFVQVDLSGHFQEWNPAFERLVGYTREELSHLTYQELTPERWHHLEAEWVESLVLTQGLSDLFEKEYRRKDGTLVPVEVRASLVFDASNQAVGMWGIVRDISERRRLEWELHHAQRLESVGQLAAGIAHEINTPIQYVSDNIRFLDEAFRGLQSVLAQYQQLLEAAESGVVGEGHTAQVRRFLGEADWEYLSEEIPKAIAQSMDGAGRVATIVRAMKEFAHPGCKEKAGADLNKALENALIVCRNELKYVADVKTDFGTLPPVVCNIAEINQVFLNLFINAAHAIAEVVRGTQQKGVITVRTRLEGDRAVIWISDTGCGIPEKIRLKVFDPFFTTKPVGRGSGQGLAIARATVVDQHGGTITFEPNGEQGTTFRVALPLEAASAEVNE